MSYLMANSALARDPVETLLASEAEGALAIVTCVEGPSYRPVGATMAILSDGTRAGTLSSGCIENDLAVHARDALESGETRAVRYGRGSPYIDIQLPCGGGLDILLVPRPNREVLGSVVAHQRNREPCRLSINRQTGALCVNEPTDDEATFTVRFDPKLRFCIFGKGPEACTFAALVQSAGYPNLVLSPDEETLGIAKASGCQTRHLPTADFPDDLKVDPWTSVILFFHDHDWEPPLLKSALETPAFYIGAQGSARARDARLLAMAQMGVSQEKLARLHGPVGLIPSARDAGTLAVSVLAEVLDKAMKHAPAMTIL